MKATTHYKLKLAIDARKNNIAVEVVLRGQAAPLKVSAIVNLAHTVLLTLDRQVGFVAVEPDEIISVWVPKLPPAFQQEAI